MATEKGSQVFDLSIETIADQLEAERAELADFYYEDDLVEFGLNEVYEDYLAGEYEA